MSCRSWRPSGALRSLPAMTALAHRLSTRFASGLDLLIDFATLGEYGLEPVDGADLGCGRIGCESGWEAFAPGRLRGCETGPGQARPTHDVGA